MRIRPQTFPLILLLVTACSSSPAVTPSLMAHETATTTPGLGATFTPTSVPTATAVLTSTASPSPTAEAIEPPVEFRCPEQREVSLADLGLSPRSRLIVVSSKERFPTDWSLVGSAMDPQRISITSVAVRPAPFIGRTSPDGRWFGFYATDVSGTGNDLWISSIDGQKQWLALQDLEHPYPWSWIDNGTIVVFGGGPLGYDWSVTSLRINPFTSETEAWPSVDLYFNDFDFSPDASQVIHLASTYPAYTWERYDFQTDTAETVFPGIDTSLIQVPTDASVNWTANGVSIAITGSGVLRLVLNRPAALVGQSGAPVMKVVLPGKATMLFAPWWSSDSSLLLLSEVLGEYGESYFVVKYYILDTVRWVLYDYCLPEKVYPGAIYGSADDSFLAWTIESRAGDPNRFVGSVVMQLATGRMALLKDVFVVGWGTENK